MLAFFDVLGFSARLQAEGLDAIVALYNQLIDTTIKQHEQNQRWEKAFRPVGESSEGTLMIPVIFGLPLRSAYFSDTILLWAPLVPMFVRSFVTHCATFVCEALRMRVPVRGSLALGDAVMHRPSSTYIGEPIVEAARLENVQKWLGVAFATSATWPEFMAEVDPRLIIEYDVPIKEGSSADGLTPVVLDWPRRWRELFATDPPEILEEMNQAHPHPYYGSTITFVQHSKANEDWHLRPDDEMKEARLRMHKGPRRAETGF